MLLLRQLRQSQEGDLHQGTCVHGTQSSFLQFNQLYALLVASALSQEYLFNIASQGLWKTRV